MGVFRKKPLLESNLWQKIWNKKIPENFFIELNNLLSDKEMLNIKLDEVNRLCRRYRISNITMHSRRLSGFYHSYLQFCLEDRKLSNSEIVELRHLKLLLGLSDRTVKQIHKSLALAIYGQELDKVMSDDVIDYQEQQFLDELCQNLYLPEELADRLLQEKAGKKLSHKLKEIMADKRITPEEEKEFRLLSENLGFTPSIDDRTQANLLRYKTYWQVENGELPRIEPGIALHSNEICHFGCEANWYETDNDTTNLEPQRLEGRVRVPRGVFWRSDEENLTGIPGSAWRKIDTGELYLTDSRLIFMGKMGRMVLNLSNIAGLIPYNDGTFVHRVKGKSPMIEIEEEEADIFALMLNRLLSENNDKEKEND